MYSIHPSLENIQHQLLELLWKYRRWILREDQQSGEPILDFIWVNEDAEKLYDNLNGILANELAAIRKREAALYGLYPYNCNPYALDD